MIGRSCEERASKSGGALFYVTVEAEFDLVSAEDGSKHVVRTFGEAMDSGDKATNKAMSAAYKYAAFQAFAIPTEGDHDADAHTHDVAADQSHVEWIDAIQGCASAEELDRLGAEIAKASLSAAAKLKVRAAFSAHKNALAKAAA